MERVASTEQGAAGDEVASTEQDAAGDKVASTEQGAAGDEVASTEQDAAGDEVASAEQGDAGDEVASTEQGAAGDEVASTEQDAAGDKVASTEQDAAGDEVASTEQDAAGDEVASTEQGDAGDEVASTEQDAAGDEVASAEQGDAGDEIASTEQGNAGDEAASTEQDAAGNEGAPAEQDAASDEDAAEERGDAGKRAAAAAAAAMLAATFTPVATVDPVSAEKNLLDDVVMESVESLPADVIMAGEDIAANMPNTFAAEDQLGTAIMPFVSKAPITTVELASTEKNLVGDIVMDSAESLATDTDDKPPIIAQTSVAAEKNSVFDVVMESFESLSADVIMANEGASAEDIVMGVDTMHATSANAPIGESLYPDTGGNAFDAQALSLLGETHPGPLPDLSHIDFDALWEDIQKAPPQQYASAMNFDVNSASSAAPWLDNNSINYNSTDWSWSTAGSASIGDYGFDNTANASISNIVGGNVGNTSNMLVGNTFGTLVGNGFSAPVSDTSNTSVSNTFGVPIGDTFGVPVSNTFSAPVSDTFGTLVGNAFSAPVGDTSNTPVSNTFGVSVGNTFSVLVGDTSSTPVATNLLSLPPAEATASDNEPDELDRLLEEIEHYPPEFFERLTARVVAAGLTIPIYIGAATVCKRSGDVLVSGVAKRARIVVKPPDIDENMLTAYYELMEFVNSLPPDHILLVGPGAGSAEDVHSAAKRAIAACRRRRKSNGKLPETN
ncbi:hypothetical protein IWW38_003526 [Coemansia aciculifera]|uniref:Uncharacterized protein n=1 Tax=Coemansia aciculifera TaxID=417176 RepID=A0ACC1M265_9FUNG|nr:hypothetical protein IWW38_003526 [Coemansia aciculifera]